MADKPKRVKNPNPYPTPEPVKHRIKADGTTAKKAASKPAKAKDA